MDLRIGTSGFSYPEWRGSFYPEDLSPPDMLRHYGRRLTAVEINQTFYRMPKRDVLEGWAREVPSEFRFALKASRRITHFKRLADVEEEVSYFLDGATGLGPRAGVVLYQLPPNFRRDLDRLDAFLDELPNPRRSAFEFRHESWYGEDTLDRLRDAGAALCIAETDEGGDPPRTPTTDWGYLRLRRTDYDGDALAAWAAWLRERREEWKEAFVFFKHEERGVGPASAARLLELLGEPT